MYPPETFIIYPVCHPLFVDGSGVLESIDTRKFYKVIYVSSGSASIHINERVLTLNGDDIIFLRPGDTVSIEERQTGSAYMCLVHAGYLSTHSPYLLDLFSHFPLHVFHRTIIALNKKQSDIVTYSFESILIEQYSRNADKKHATALHLQMILLQIQRAGRKACPLAVAAGPTHSLHRFPLSESLQ